METGITSMSQATWQQANGEMDVGSVQVEHGNTKERLLGRAIQQAGGLKIHQVGGHQAVGRRLMAIGTTSMDQVIW